MKSILLAFALIASTAGGAVAGSLTWIEFAHDAGAFKVKMPGLPVESIQQVGTEAGAVDMHFFTYQDEQLEFMVAFADYPSIFRTVDPDVILNGARDGFVKSTNGTLTRDREITLADFPGRELFVESFDGAVSGRVYFVGTRLYQVIVAGDVRMVNGPAARQFFDSFQFELPPPQSRLAEMLDLAGLEYELDEDGDYSVLFNFAEEGRSQLVFLSEKVSNITGRPYYTALSFVHGDMSGPSPEITRSLLYINSTLELGYFMMYEDGRGQQVVAYLAELSPDLDAMEFNEVVRYAASVADEVEQDLFGTDEF